MTKFYTFQHPYLLLEDASGKYRPVYKEYKLSLPSFKLLVKPPGNPHKPRTTQPGVEKKTRQVKIGYCEVCCVKFTDYESHIQATAHREFALDEKNYEKIDAIIRGISAEAKYCDALNGLGMSKSPTHIRHVKSVWPGLGALEAHRAANLEIDRICLSPFNENQKERDLSKYESTEEFISYMINSPVNKEN